MAQSFITAARLMAHKIVNGKYQTTLAMDKFPITGIQVRFQRVAGSRSLN